VVAVFTYFFADADILLVTPLLTSAGTAVIGLCLKLAVLVGFTVQVAHQVAVPDLADARARKDPDAIKEALVKHSAFRLPSPRPPRLSLCCSARLCSLFLARSSKAPSCHWSF
jgi:hypothetical protein